VSLGSWAGCVGKIGTGPGCIIDWFPASNPSSYGSGSFLRRDVAQPGRALAWGARGRQFKSARPDHSFVSSITLGVRFCLDCRPRAAQGHAEQRSGCARRKALRGAARNERNRQFKSARPDHSFLLSYCADVATPHVRRPTKPPKVCAEAQRMRRRRITAPRGGRSPRNRLRRQSGRRRRLSSVLLRCREAPSPVPAWGETRESIAASHRTAVPQR
jgi:hypothetical protein